VLFPPSHSLTLTRDCVTQYIRAVDAPQASPPTTLTRPLLHGAL
jgi:hypothetical protein